MIYYIKPMHKQGAFAGTDSEIAECPVTDEICETVLSLPLDSYKTDEEINTVAKAMKELL